MVSAQATDQVKSAARQVSAAELTATYASGVGVADEALVLMSASGGTAVSAVLAAPIPFQAVSVHWLAANGPDCAQVAIRSGPDGENWSNWQILQPDTLADVGEGNLRRSALAFPTGDELYEYLQCAVMFKPAADGSRSYVRGFSLRFIDAREGPSSMQFPSAAEFGAAGDVTAAADKPPVVSRTDWGCPDGQQSPSWPPECYTAGHVVIHHTATSNTSSNWASVVRAIWNYHSIDLDWGDIGYNFLVDPNGVIYEGRAGANLNGHVDDDVEGGHAGSFNRRTVGLSFIGTYETVTPTDAALDAAKSLMAWKFAQRGLNPQEDANIIQTCSGVAISKPRIASHRDYAGYAKTLCPDYWTYDPNNTSCPGQALWELLPSIRASMPSLMPTYSANLSAQAISPTLVAVGSTLKVTVTVTNTGNVTLRSGTPDPSFVYEEGSVAGGVPANIFRIGVDYEGRDPGQGAYPYRWGLGGDLAPGQSRTIDVYILIRNESARKYWVGLIREQQGLVADHLRETLVYARNKLPNVGEVYLAKVTVRPPSVVFTGNVVEVSAEVQNWTNAQVRTQGPDPGYVYREGEICPADVPGAYRMALGYDGQPANKDHPYRWGVGTVPPLSVRTIKGFVKLTTPRAARNYWVGFVQEQVRWWQDNMDKHAITVKDPTDRIVMPLIRN